MNTKLVKTLPEWILFDLGNVVVRLNPHSLEQRLALALPDEKNAVAAIFKDDFQLGQTQFSLNERLQLGQVSEKEFFLALAAAYSNRLPEADVLRAINLVLNGEFPWVYEIITKLKNNYKLATLSNTHAFHLRVMQQEYQSMQLFDFIGASHLLRAAKPTPECFAKLLAEIKVPAQECLLIDDRLPNIKGAEQVGMQTLWLERPEELETMLRAKGLLLPGTASL